MTNHFSNLTEAEQERLAILIEECSEVIHVGCKILRHGYKSNNKDKMNETNRDALNREIGDLGHALDRMASANDIDDKAIDVHIKTKSKHITQYLHHQELNASKP
jgi:hypothetical protein